MICIGVDDMINTTDNTISIIELTMKIYDLYHQALLYVKMNNHIKAQECLDRGNKLLLEASYIHTFLLSQESEMNLLLVHAEDMLISVQLYKSMMKEIVEVYKKFPTLKGN